MSQCFVLLPPENPERWPSGRRRTPGKCVSAESASRVRIPISPQILLIENEQIIKTINNKTSIMKKLIALFAVFAIFAFGINNVTIAQNDKKAAEEPATEQVTEAQEAAPVAADQSHIVKAEDQNTLAWVTGMLMSL